jgi:hypothetical protein
MLFWKNGKKGDFYGKIADQSISEPASSTKGFVGSFQQMPNTYGTTSCKLTFVHAKLCAGKIPLCERALSEDNRHTRCYHGVWCLVGGKSGFV